MRATLFFIIALVASFLLLTPVWKGAAGQGQTIPGSEAINAPARTVSLDTAVAADDETPQLSSAVLSPEIGRRELEIRLVPLTKMELAALSAEWLSFVKEKAEEVMEAQIAIASSEGTDAEQAREGLARLTEERRRLVDTSILVLDGWETKGAPEEEIAEARSYLDAVIDQTILVSDIQTLLSAIASWLADEEGGIALAKKIVIILFSFYGLILAAKIIRLFVRRHVVKLPKVSVLLQTFLAEFAYWVVLAVGLLAVLSLLGVESMPLLAAFGGASVIIGLALQDTLGNFANGLMIMMNRPFDEGDYVDIGGTSGTVKSVSIVATTITTPDNQVIVIPNKQAWGNVIINRTATDTRRVDLVFSIGYDDDIQHAVQVLKEAVAEHPLTLDDPEPTIAVASLAESSVDILCGPWTKTSDYLMVYRELTADVKARFDAAGITIPYPQRDLHIHAAPDGEANRPSDVAPAAASAAAAAARTLDAERDEPAAVAEGE